MYFLSCLKVYVYQIKANFKISLSVEGLGIKAALISYL
ncbi:hypothetical protein Cst_c20420 [Thermoclostridium stercorarium subsp. stercorarium DSM 8532]|uniref:Uncharacterized protein n=1 Tax=Thermoclostridium stercorarium (strain ATCC 35414 / DSM 8532 / NCIMB 11754) TaxID=1121335 RepID=L7VLF4_THES1|nr:hypothetical protein Cst_c20420 [Thermoclostridium stercorarium subsp. stercorarium DSM 8532]